MKGDDLIGNSVCIKESEQSAHLVETPLCVCVGRQRSIRQELIKQWSTTYTTISITAYEPPNDYAPLCFTYSPILSAEVGSRPFSSVISFFTSDHGDYPRGSAQIGIQHVV
jgi:hypothetical protein